MYETTTGLTDPWRRQIALFDVQTGLSKVLVDEKGTSDNYRTFDKAYVKFSPNGKNIGLFTREGGIVRSIEDATKFWKFALPPGAADNWASILSQHGGAVLVLGGTKGAFLVRTAEPPRSLGVLGKGSVRLVGEAEFVITTLENNSVTLYDLRTPVMQPGQALGGASLTKAVCKASADGILPFPAAARTDNSTADARARASILRGRPWNPCDWRGLLAFENGWEGMRQWVRHVGVRYFRQADYACGEVNAQGKRSPRRLRGCTLAGN